RFQLSAVVNIKRSENIVFLESFQYLRIRPHGLFHFPAVHAAPAGKVKQDRFVYLPGIGKSLFIVVKRINAMWSMEYISVFFNYSAGGCGLCSGNRVAVLMKVKVLRWRRG